MTGMQKDHHSTLERLGWPVVMMAKGSSEVSGNSRELTLVNPPICCPVGMPSDQILLGEEQGDQFLYRMKKSKGTRVSSGNRNQSSTLKFWWLALLLISECPVRGDEAFDVYPFKVFLCLKKGFLPGMKTTGFIGWIDQSLERKSPTGLGQSSPGWLALGAWVEISVKHLWLGFYSPHALRS